MKKITYGLLFKSKKLLTVTKLTFFLMCLSIIQVSGSAYSQGQELQIQMKNVTLEQVFAEIRKQTDYDFLYDTNLLKDQSKVSTNLGRTSVDDILQSVLPSTLDYQIVDKTIVIKKNVTAENIPSELLEDLNIQGTVFDELGEGLPGVSVLVQGTLTGTVTDIEGNYNITADENAVLIVSYVGYTTQEIPVNGQSQITTTLMPDIRQLSDVVVIGYGTQKKSDVTGSVSIVEGIEGLPLTNAEEGLQGRVAGVTIVSAGGDPTSTPTIQIRGMGSTSDESPLYVVDGVPYYGGPINPNDIASMSILKDAASTAIYGVRAAGGVVLITTKKGESGAMQVDFGSFVGFQQVWNKPTALNAQEQSAAYQLASDNAGVDVDPIHDPIANPDGQITRTNWVDEIFQTGVIENYDLAIRGGSDKIVYSTSLGYNKKEGTLRNTQAERLSFRINTELTLTDKLKVGENISFTRTNGNSVFTGTQTSTGGSNYNGIIVQAMAAPPAISVFDTNGDYSGIPSAYGDTFNVVAALDRVDIDNPTTDLFGNLYLNYQIIDGLSFRSSLGINSKENRFKEFIPRVPEASKIQSNVNYITEATSKQTDWSFENTFTYNKSINKHTFTLLGGYTLQSFALGQFSITGRNIPNEDPNSRYLINATEFDTPTSSIQENTLTSYLGRVNYSYDGKYLVSASVRRDGSSKLAGDNRWGVFPAAAFGWMLSKENFMSDISFINKLKLRASWGKIGNISSLSNYPTNVPLSQTQVILGGDNYVNGFALDGISNPDITWETSTQSNFGVDALLFEGRISMTAEYFVKNTNDLILPLPLTGLAGVSNAPFVNAGQVRNKGMELELSYIEEDREFTYQISANISNIKNELVALDNGVTEIVDATEVRTHAPIQSEVGQPLFSFYLVETDGIFQSDEEVTNYALNGTPIQPNAQAGDLKFIDQNGDGVITEEDRVYMGNAFPEISYGFNASLGYKNFDMSFFFQGVNGSQAYNGFKFTTLSAAGAGFNLSTEVKEAWSPTNLDGTIPQLSTSDPNNNQRKSDYFLENTDYLRLKNLTVGYTVPKINRVRSLRVYATAQNLLTVTGYSGLDPEVSSKGVDGGQYPVSRAFIFGFNIGL